MTFEEYWKIEKSLTLSEQLSTAKELGYEVEKLEEDHTRGGFLIKKDDKPVLVARYLNFMMDRFPETPLFFAPYACLEFQVNLV